MTTDHAKLNERADEIAMLIAQTPVEDRGILYDLVATYLTVRNQGHQAKLFRELRERG